jgi:hypothetical protein
MYFQSTKPLVLTIIIKFGKHRIHCIFFHCLISLAFHYILQKFGSCKNILSENGGTVYSRIFLLLAPLLDKQD